MKRSVITALILSLALGQVLLARRFNRGSISSESRGSWGRSSGSWQSQGGGMFGSRSVTQTGDGFDVNRQMQTQGGASRDVNRSVDTQDGSVSRTSTATNQWGQSVTRSRDTQAQGGYATVTGGAATNTGREANGQATIGRNAYGQPAIAGSVNTKYSGSYAGAAARNPYGGWSGAAVGPYGGRVTTTLPSGYRTTTYYGRSYYSYGGAYYRPYVYLGVPYYYPVPPPYFAFYPAPPVGAMMVAFGGVTYLVAQGNYARQTTNSSGQVVYMSVPAPVGAGLSTLPVQRVIVTLSGTPYYIYGNTFYRRVVDGSKESFVVVTAPPGAVFLSALPPDFKVVQANTMYFSSQGKYYVPYLATDGRELYVQVDTPPQPDAAGSAPAPTAPATPPGTAPAPAIRMVNESFSIPTGTLVIVRLAADVSSDTAVVGDRVQGFLDQDISANGRLLVPHGGRVYGIVSAVERGSKGGKQPSLSVTLTDMTVGTQVETVKTQPLTIEGRAPKGRRKLFGGAGLGMAIGAIANGGEGAAIGGAIGAAAGGAAMAAGQIQPAMIAAQTPEAFTMAVPMQVNVMTSVAVR